MIGAFLNWLEHTLGKGPSPDGQSWSEALLGSLNFWSLLEGTHLIALMLFAGTIMVVDLRLLGVTFRKTKVSTISDAILPLTIYSFVFVVLTGTGLLFAKPIYYYHNVQFLVKMVFLALALLNIVVFHGRVQATQGSWDADETPPKAARMSAAASLVLWTLVIICGRFIPYNWYDCGKPQPDFINWVQQCKTSEKGEENMAGQRFDAQMWKAQP
ncbi:DUF6644 family protein [Phenylobacterium sp.]|jgi:hypothetical protein|uniref:DUF6644 family protein n=1 Tax=Phenylobacterium sp. TaxID=1871053 RepID=UPI002E31F443|nr:DUF6644 family protein [Phenylobacterium sp.]HEX3363631.1 DUF6644 family protein [Phenylobacterium sp.]